MYRAIYRARSDGDWDLVAVFGLDVIEEEMPFHRLEAMCQSMFGQDEYKEFKFDSLEDVVDVLEGEDSQTVEVVLTWGVDDVEEGRRQMYLAGAFHFAETELGLSEEEMASLRTPDGDHWSFQRTDITGTNWFRIVRTDQSEMPPSKEDAGE